MQKLNKLIQNPSGLDSMDNYMGSIPEDNLLVVMTRNRDSDLLTESNWDVALAMLGGESDNVQIDRFGHWACGWWESMSVVEGSPEHKKAIEIQKSLKNYPVLDDQDLAERELEEANRIWADCYNKTERVEYIRKFRNQFEFHDFKDLMACVRGRYFAGYASELVD